MGTRLRENNPVDKINMIYIDESEPEGELEPAFPYRDVTIKRNVDANNLYEILGEVGRGKFGTVYKCREKETGLKLAAKFVPIPKREDRRNVEREVEIMNSLQHHLIIQLYAAYEYQKMMVVVLELIGGGELFDRVVDDEFVLNERVCIVFIRQVCEAMEFIHRNNILHLDLKPENILCLTQNGNRIKVIDFGLARKYDPNKRLQILFGTPEFVAPEVVNFDCISYATDMWSIGVICYVLISGLSPFMGETDIETMANVTIAKYDFEDEAFHNISADCIDFISKLLVKDVGTRMTAEQCLQHKWLRHRPKPSLIKAPLEEPTPKNLPTVQQQQPNFNEHILNINGKDEVTIKPKDMESTKDNLKNFIERWEEHPNSPYVFDIETNSITPLTDSISSSRVCSPSPCASIDTVTDDDETKCENKPINDNDSVCTISTPMNESREKLFPNTTSGNITPTPTQIFNEKWDKFDDLGSNADNFRERSLKSYLHTFDRRNSDTSYLVNRRPSGERINLADEIRKLSDHLLMLAEINTKLGNETKNELSTKKTTNSGNITKTTTHKTASSSKTKTSTFKSKSSATSSATTSTNSKTSNGESINKNSLSKRLQQSIEETPTLSRAVPSSKTTVHTTNMANVKSKTEKNKSAMETAKTRRSKFRVNQMSRDVPIGVPNTHQPVNLEEAANTTKDCLLHLLEKYNESKARNPLGRHQSISVDWNFSDNLEHRSMSSINAFFQRHTNTGENVRQLQAQLENKSVEKKN